MRRFLLGALILAAALALWTILTATPAPRFSTVLPAPSPLPAAPPAPLAAPAPSAAEAPPTDAPVPGKEGTGSIEGVVLALDGAPAAGAAVRAVPVEGEGAPVVVLAGADGSFRLDGLVPGPWKVMGGGAGFGTRLDDGGGAAEAVVTAGATVRVEFRVQALARLSGTVIDPDGRPVAGASVKVQCDAFLSPTGGVWILDATTAEDGTWAQRNVTPGGRVRVLASARGFAPADREFRSLGPGSRTVVDLALERPASLDILLLAEEGGVPVSAALVWISDAEGGHLYDGGKGDAFVPDAEGRVRADALRPRAVKVQVDAGGFVRVPDTEVNPVGRTEPLVFRLRRAFALEGRRVGSDGSPLAGQWIEARPVGEVVGGDGDGDPFGSSHSGHTKEDGAFRIDGLPPGRWEVGFFGGGMDPEVSEIVEAGATGVLLRMPAGRGPRTLRVRVVDPEGRPVPLFRSRTAETVEDGLISSSGGGHPGGGPLTVALEEGLTTVLEIWDAMDEKENRLPLGHVLLAVPADAPADWTVALPPERFVAGHVVGAGGVPVEGVSVEVVTVPGDGRPAGLATTLAGTTTGAGGVFRVSGLGTGHVRLRGAVDGWTCVPVEAVPGNVDVVITMVPEADCRLQILDAGGLPLVGAHVLVTMPGMVEGAYSPPEIEETDEDGRVRLRGLLPDRPCRLQVFPQGKNPGVLPYRRDGWMPASGDIRLEAPTELEGRVLVDGAPPPEGWKGCVQVRQDGETLSSADVGADGSFRLRFLPPGVHSLVVLRAPAEGEEEWVEVGSGEGAGGGPTVVLDVRGR